VGGLDGELERRELGFEPGALARGIAGEPGLDVGGELVGVAAPAGEGRCPRGELAERLAVARDRSMELRDVPLARPPPEARWVCAPGDPYAEALGADHIIGLV